jgi:hypothetical protein
MAIDSNGQDLSISRMNMVRSAVMIDNDTQKQREKKKKQDEERPADKLELTSVSTDSSGSVAPEQSPATITTGVKIDILAR